MALSGKLEADFSSFVQEVNKAVVSLTSFETKSEEVAGSLSHMADRFSGTKIIQSGLEINRLFQSTQDLAILTEKELAEVGRIAAESADKMARLGMAVPDNLKKIATEAENAGGKTNDLHGAFMQFDKLLATVGINISSEVAAVQELAGAFSEGASSLGLFAQAGLVVGTLIASYKIASWVVEWTGLKTAIDGVADSLAGLKAEEAGAKADVLARATKNLRDITGNSTAVVTDFNLALKINEEALRQHTLTTDTSEKRVAGWHKEIAAVQDRGEFAQLTTDLQSQAFTLADLEKRYALSAGALAQFKRDQDEAADAAKAQAAERKKLSDQQLKDVADYIKAKEAEAKLLNDFAIKTHGIAMKNEQEIAKERQKGLEDRNAQVLAGFTSTQKLEAENLDFVRKATLSETDYKILKINEWADAEIRAFKGTAEQLDAFTAQVKTRADQQKAALMEVVPIVTLIGQTAAEAEAQRKAATQDTGDAYTSEMRRQQEAFMGFRGIVVAGTQEMSAAQNALTQVMTNSVDSIQRDWAIMQAQRDRGEIFLTGMSASRIPIQTRATGGPVMSGQTYLVGEQGPELFRPSRGGTISPNGAGGGMVNNFYVNGSVKDLARPLMNELTRLMQQSRQWPSA